MRHRTLRASAAILTSAALITASPSPAAHAVPPGDRTVMVQLFQWKWTDVARECETFLGPKGFGAVQVSPPQEHVVLPNAGQGGYPWWQDYQPVGYPGPGFATLTTRRGDVTAFRDMIRRCHAAGVKIFADAVINHMTGQSGGGTGSAGTTFPDKYTYPARTRTPTSTPAAATSPTTATAGRCRTASWRAWPT